MEHSYNLSMLIRCSGVSRRCHKISAQIKIELIATKRTDPLWCLVWLMVSSGFPSLCVKYPVMSWVMCKYISANSWSHTNSDWSPPINGNGCSDANCQFGAWIGDEKIEYSNWDPLVGSIEVTIASLTNSPLIIIRLETAQSIDGTLSCKRKLTYSLNSSVTDRR